MSSAAIAYKDAIDNSNLLVWKDNQSQPILKLSLVQHSFCIFFCESVNKSLKPVRKQNCLSVRIQAVLALVQFNIHLI